MLFSVCAKYFPSFPLTRIPSLLACASPRLEQLPTSKYFFCLGVYRNAPKSIFHSWVEINFENQWYELEAFILDKTYIKKLQEQNSECTGAFCGYGVAVKDFRNLIIEFDRNNTYIQSEGINQDFGVYDCPDELLKEHHQEISAFKAFAYRHIGRHLMNRNIRKIRER